MMIGVVLQIAAAANKTQCEEVDLTYEMCSQFADQKNTTCEFECDPIMLAHCYDLCHNGNCRQKWDSMYYECNPISYFEKYIACLDTCDAKAICYYEAEGFACVTCNSGYISNGEQTECVSSASYYGCTRLISLLSDSAQNLQSYCLYSETTLQYLVASCPTDFIHAKDFMSCVGNATMEGCLVQVLDKRDKYCKQIFSGFFEVASCKYSEIYANGGLSCQYASQLQYCQYSCRDRFSFCKHTVSSATMPSYVCSPCYSRFVSVEDRTACVPINSSNGCSELCKNGICTSRLIYYENRTYEAFSCELCRPFEVLFNNKCEYEYSQARCISSASIFVDTICSETSALHGQAFHIIRCPAPTISNKLYSQCQAKLDYCRAECYSAAVYCKLDVENPRGYTCTQCPFGYRNSDDRTHCVYIDDESPDKYRDLLIIIIILCTFIGVALIVFIVFGIVKYMQCKERAIIAREQQKNTAMRNYQNDKSYLDLQREQLTREYLEYLAKLMAQNAIE